MIKGFEGFKSLSGFYREQITRRSLFVVLYSTPIAVFWILMNVAHQISITSFSVIINCKLDGFLQIYRHSCGLQDKL